MKIQTIGSDIEFFLEKNGQLISSIGLIPGSKKKPFEIGDGVQVHPDNISMEITMPPATNEDEFVSTVEKAVMKATEYVKSKDQLIDISKSLASTFASEDLLNHPKARQFGCEVDFNAVTLMTNERPNPINNLRSCGAHVHVGLPFEYLSEKNVRKCVLMMDIFLGVPSIILDTDKNRRSIYGKASSFRYKKYGFEYRSLSNFWTKDTALIKWVYQNTSTAIELALQDNDINWEEVEQAVTIINTQDETLAKTFVELLNIKLP